jgi:phage tail protein X
MNGSANGQSYVSVQGDMWDLVSLRVYGMQKGADHYMDKLLEANPALHDYCQLPGGLTIIVPDVPVQSAIVLVPWKQATITSS